MASALADADTFGRWFARHRAMWPGDRRDVGGSYLAWALSRLIVRGVMFGLCVSRRAWTLDLSDLFVYESPTPRGDEGDTLVGVAFAGRMVALAGDPATFHDGVIVVADEGALIERAADEIVAALGPVLAAVRSVANFGLVGIWGATVDDIGASAVMAARVVPLERAVETSDALVDALRQRARHIRLLPTIEMVKWTGGVTPVSIKGTCCMRYKTQDHPDPAGEGFCENCPKRDRPALVARYCDVFEALGVQE